jgi:hypothetical protein
MENNENDENIEKENKEESENSEEDKNHENNGNAEDFAEPSHDNIDLKCDIQPSNNLDNVISVIRYFMARFEGSPLHVDR